MKELFEGIWNMPADDLVGIITRLVVGFALAMVLYGVVVFGFVHFWSKREFNKTFGRDKWRRPK